MRQEPALALPSANMPYFDGILERLAANDPLTIAAFGRHVHWGYWPDPGAATGSGTNYGVAAERLCRAVCDAAPIENGMRILDVGCGFGGTIASLNERFCDLELIGVNIDARQLERAAETVRPINGNTIDFVQADAASIPLSGQCFDVILAVECVFHFDRERFFAEAARLLHVNGSLALSDFVPTDRAVEFLHSFGLFSADDVIRQSYGDTDLTYSISRYCELAKENDLTLQAATSITDGTLPTYPFLYSSTESWPDADQVALFTRATRMLEKACRTGILDYQILSFSPSDG